RRTPRELKALGAVFIAELGLGPRDTMLSAYPLTTAAAIAQFWAGLRAGCGIALHHPFDFAAFLDQLRDTGATCTCVPAAVIDAMDRRGDFGGPAARLSRIGCVWPTPHAPASPCEPPLPVFDIHSLGEMAVILRQREPAAGPALLPLGKLYARGAGEGTAPYLETRVRGSVRNGGAQKTLRGELLIRGTTVPGSAQSEPDHPGEGPPAHDAHGYIDSGVHCSVDETHPGLFACERDAEIIYHGGAAIPVRELDRIYADYPGFLDAAAFTIDDPVMGDRIFAAVIPRPELSLSLDTFRRYLSDKGIAPFKAPDRLVVVRDIPRRADGSIERASILNRV
ncbi:MAG: hypothetical protein VX871_04705, partial [Pseudomonadota bacterium]|nr:hypothetical protein [Pseudomonadota bacterium]